MVTFQGLNPTATKNIGFFESQMMSDSVEVRKLRTIYDAMDAYNYKLAVQLCNKALKKNSLPHVFKVN